jgi:hypothetical protein
MALPSSQPLLSPPDDNVNTACPPPQPGKTRSPGWMPTHLRRLAHHQRGSGRGSGGTRPQTNARPLTGNTPTAANWFQEIADDNNATANDSPPADIAMQTSVPLQIDADNPGKMCGILDAHRQEFSKELELLRGKHNLNYSESRRNILALKHSLNVIAQIFCSNADKSAKANREIQDTLRGALDKAENLQETVIQQSVAIVWLCQMVDALSATVSQLEAQPPLTPRPVTPADGFCPIDRSTAPSPALGTPTAPPEDSTQHVKPTVEQPCCSSLDHFAVTDEPLNVSRSAWAMGPGGQTSTALASTQAPRGESVVPVGRRTLAPPVVEDLDSHAPPTPNQYITAA